MFYKSYIYHLATLQISPYFIRTQQSTCQYILSCPLPITICTYIKTHVVSHTAKSNRSARCKTNDATTTREEFTGTDVVCLECFRFTVVSREAKKEQSESPKTKRTTNYCVSFTRANVFVI